MNLKAANKQPWHDFVNNTRFSQNSQKLEFYKSISAI